MSGLRVVLFQKYFKWLIFLSLLESSDGRWIIWNKFEEKSTVWVSFEWINHNMRNNRICYVWLPAGRSYVFPQLWIFSWGLQPHPTLSRGVVVLWFRLPTQSFRLTVLVFTNDFEQFLKYSKASRYTASSCTDLAGARFWIGSKNVWDARFYTFLHVFARFCMFLHVFARFLHVF